MWGDLEAKLIFDSRPWVHRVVLAAVVALGSMMRADKLAGLKEVLHWMNGLKHRVIYLTRRMEEMSLS